MSQDLISHSADLKKLRDEGFEVKVKESYLLVNNIPYVNSKKEIAYGIFVSKLTLAGDVTTKPDDHVMYFIGEHPCNNDGTIITAIQHESKEQTFVEGVTINHSFSNKPQDGYKDYYHKVITYMNIISAQAESIDNSVTAKTFKVVEAVDPETVFHYLDTNSSRAEIGIASSKLEKLKVAIIGTGGTGSYVLDFVSKTPVKEINLFDEDFFLQHNAFRAPGAASKEKLKEKPKKVNYLYEIYSKMHKGIIPHDFNLSSSNINDVLKMDFVFICIDSGETKKLLIDKLITNGTPFIDAGIGIQVIDDSLIGSVRTTTVTKDKNDHVNRISFSEEGNNDYAQNVQIAELNALNASLAVIKWKKMFKFYHDQEKENYTVYDISLNKLFNDEINS